MSPNAWHYNTMSSHAKAELYTAVSTQSDSVSLHTKESIKAKKKNSEWN